jgi:hypothetical protein
VHDEDGAVEGKRGGLGAFVLSALRAFVVHQGLLALEGKLLAVGNCMRVFVLYVVSAIAAIGTVSGVSSLVLV